MKNRLKALIYFYIFSTIFDGAFRKWILPQISDSLMIVKSIIAVAIFIEGVRYWNRFSNWEISSILLGFISFVLSLLAGHGNLAVAIFGCYPFLIGIPVCFIIGEKLNKADIIKIGKWFVFIAIVNSIFIIVQFMLPVTHLLNFGGGSTEGIEGVSVSSLAGGFRPPGIFYHNTQNVAFCSLAFAFMLYFYFVRKNEIKKYLLLLALLLELISIVLSSSRTNVFVHLGVVAFFFLFATNKERKRSFLKVVVISIPLVIVIVSTDMMESALDNLIKRFESASETQYRGSSTIEGTINDIVYRGFLYNLDALIEPKTFSGEEPPFWGYGQGMGTQVGGRLLKLGKDTSGFALAEWDGLRIMCESGLLMGWLIIFVRIGYAFRFFFRVTSLKYQKQILSLCILPSFLLMFYLTSTWGNVFICNFAFIVGGLFLASLRFKEKYGY